MEDLSTARRIDTVDLFQTAEGEAAQAEITAPEVMSEADIALAAARYRVALHHGRMLRNYPESSANKAIFLIAEA
jgi:hypothetical protein